MGLVFSEFNAVRTNHGVERLYDLGGVGDRSGRVNDGWREVIDEVID